MKKLFIRFFKWCWRVVQQVYAFLYKIVVAIPHQVIRAVLRFAERVRNMLDKRINHIQKEQLHTIVFESDTPQGRRFDTILTWVIIASIAVVIFETVSEFHRAYWWLFFVLEWLFTIIFTIEYILRLYCSKNVRRYASSFFGIVDLLAIIPSYLSIFLLGAQNLLIVRALRLLRIFRIFKMGHFVREGEIILSALRASRNKVYVFLSFVLLMAMIVGSVLYIVEGGSNPNLDNIPKGIYWAVVTLTTVGYGDVTPITTAGKMLATVVMIMGYGVIAVPTGIVTAEISSRVMNLKEIKYEECNRCGQKEHHKAAIHCHRCGSHLGFTS